MNKYSREIKVGLLAVLALFLLYFGFNFLKGVNIFSPTHTYCGIYSNLKGLTEQAPVYVRGYKVGQVDRIVYDFSKEDAFCVYFSVDKNIAVPVGTECALVSDGLLGGMALQLEMPFGENDAYAAGDTIPTTVVPGLMDALQNEVMTKLSGVLSQIDSLLATVNEQLEGDHLRHALKKVDDITADLAVTSAGIRGMMKEQIPALVTDVREAVADVKIFADNLGSVDLAATVGKMDTTLNRLNELTENLNSTDGTLGLLLNDRQLYLNLTGAVADADSLLIDLKNNPKRYVHFSLFGRKEKK